MYIVSITHICESIEYIQKWHFKPIVKHTDHITTRQTHAHTQINDTLNGRKIGNNTLDEPKTKSKPAFYANSMKLILCHQNDFKENFWKIFFWISS